mmetsp:Transcript_35121/g.88504  ORF Transcript_35121/g.88504 Transcript_35121/m.88504 type:complete len:212 (+) Transcript_35121:440-1075(+)
MPTTALGTCSLATPRRSSRPLTQAPPALPPSAEPTIHWPCWTGWPLKSLGRSLLGLAVGLWAAAVLAVLPLSCGREFCKSSTASISSCWTASSDTSPPTQGRSSPPRTAPAQPGSRRRCGTMSLWRSARPGVPISWSSPRRPCVCIPIWKRRTSASQRTLFRRHSMLSVQGITPTRRPSLTPQLTSKPTLRRRLYSCSRNTPASMSSSCLS